MWVTKTAALALLTGLVCSDAFVVPHHARSSSRRVQQKQQQQHKSSALYSTTESDAERFLRMARELRAQAEADEHAIHSDLLTKKAKRDEDTDKLIDQLFSSASDKNSSLLDRLRQKKCSSDMLVRVVDRLLEREVHAKGLEHVEPSLHHDHTKFHRVASDVNQQELSRVEGWIDDLMNACAVLDEEMLAERQERGVKHIPHAETQHWHLGEAAKALHDRVREKRREHDEQFQKRLESFYEAQRKKDLPPTDKKKKIKR